MPLSYPSTKAPSVLKKKRVSAFVLCWSSRICHSSGTRAKLVRVILKATTTVMVCPNGNAMRLPRRNPLAVNTSLMSQLVQFGHAVGTPAFAIREMPPLSPS